MILGIVITLFNNASTIERAINSIKLLKEKIKDRKELQIFVVTIDDNSSDGTQKYIKRYFEERLIDQYLNKTINKGVSDSRNIGIAMCQHTDYLAFLDGDDELDERCGQALIDNYFCEDLITFPFAYRNEHKKTYKHFFTNNFRVTNSKLVEYLTNYLIRPNEHSLLTTCWSKLYKTAIFINNRALRFKTTLSVAEDTEFVFNFLLRCSEISYIDVPIYNHWLSIGRDNLKKATFGNAKDIAQLFSFLIALKTCRRLLLSRGLTKPQLNPKLYHCIGAYTIIYTIRSCMHINSYESLMMVYSELRTILKKRIITIALNYYDPSIANGNKILPRLIRLKFYFIATCYASIICRNRYG